MLQVQNLPWPEASEPVWFRLMGWVRGAAPRARPALRRHRLGAHDGQRGLDGASGRRDAGGRGAEQAPRGVAVANLTGEGTRVRIV